MDYFTKVKKLILDSLRFFLENIEQRFIQIKNIKNTLNDTSIDKPLSANMGNVLANKITNFNSNIGDGHSLNPEFKSEFDVGGLIGVINRLVTKINEKANSSHADPNGSNGVADVETYGHVQLSYGLEHLDTMFLTGHAASAYTCYLLLQEIRKLDNTLGQKKVLWTGGTGGMLMHESQSVTLTQSLSEQRYGIVLCWSGFDPNTQKATDTDWWYTFVPKWHFSGGGVHCSFTGHWNNVSKYVYVEGNKIRGHQFNDEATRTVGGITVSNNKSVLRHVWGV